MKYDRYKQRQRNVNRKIILIEKQKKNNNNKRGTGGWENFDGATSVMSKNKRMTKSEACRTATERKITWQINNND